MEEHLQERRLMLLCSQVGVEDGENEEDEEEEEECLTPVRQVYENPLDR